MIKKIAQFCCIIFFISSIIYIGCEKNDMENSRLIINVTIN